MSYRLNLRGNSLEMPGFVFVFLFVCFSQTVPASGYYSTETPLPFIHNLKTHDVFFFVAGALEANINYNAVVLCNLTRETVEWRSQATENLDWLNR